MYWKISLVQRNETWALQTTHYRDYFSILYYSISLHTTHHPGPNAAGVNRKLTTNMHCPHLEQMTRRTGLFLARTLGSAGPHHGQSLQGKPGDMLGAGSAGP